MTVTTIAQFLERSANFHNEIAEITWPDGVVLECVQCDHIEHVTTAQCANSLRHGWPKHCGRTMHMMMPEEADQ